jgi:hypothetical protein
MMYWTNIGKNNPRHKEIKQRLKMLKTWWGDRMLSDVKGANCRAYNAWRCSQPRKSA